MLTARTRTATPRARRAPSTPTLPVRTTCAPPLRHCAQPVTRAAVVAAWATHDVDLTRYAADGEHVVRAYLAGTMEVIDEVLTDRYPTAYSVRRYAATHVARALTAAWQGYRRTLEAL